MFPAPKAAAGEGKKTSKIHATNSMEPKFGVDNAMLKRGNGGAMQRKIDQERMSS
jgi:hypothetical protein